MTITEFIAQMEMKGPPASDADISLFESKIGARLPTDYRAFLAASNGGYIGGSLWFEGLNPDGQEVSAGVHHIGGFRTESHFSLDMNRACYQHPEDLRIPRDLIWIMDDPFGNAICLGIAAPHCGKVYFWDHENEFHPGSYDGTAATAENLTLIANSFTDFIGGMSEFDE